MTISLAGLSGASAAVIQTRLSAAGITAFTVHDRDDLTQVPEPPYCVVDLTTTGFGWHESLELDATSGIVAVQVSSVAQRVDAAMWALDRIRAVVGAVDPAELVLPGTTRVTAMWSSGSPSPPIPSGDFVTAPETYYAHLEAS